VCRSTQVKDVQAAVRNVRGLQAIRTDEPSGAVSMYWGHVVPALDGGLWMVVEQLVEWMSGRGNRSDRRKPAPVPLWPPQI
jgi:hypothetical protein